MSRTMDKPNKVKAKLIVEVEAEFYDDESSEETLRYCVEQDLEDAGLNVIDVSVMKWRFQGKNGGIIMEKKIIDFGINSYGGYYIKYSDGTTRTLCKEQFIKILNREIS